MWWWPPEIDPPDPRDPEYQRGVLIGVVIALAIADIILLVQRIVFIAGELR